MTDTTQTKTDTFTTDTWCPVFSGFYNTIWEADTESEIDYVNTEREANGKAPIDWDDCTFDYAVYREDVTRQFVAELSGILKDAGYITGLIYKELRSPKEYNFTNDAIDIEAVFTEANVKTIEKAIANNTEAWKTYLRERYTSRSGFYSSYSNDWEDWPISESLEHSHKAGSILHFLAYLIDSDIEMDIYETVQGNTGLSCTNATELIKGVK